MQKIKSKQLSGFSLIEVILAVAIFSIFSAVAITFSFQALQVERQGNEKELAIGYAEEGIEIVRAICDDSFSNLNDTESSGLEFSNGKWNFSGENNELSIFKRIISVYTVKRDENGNIVDDNGTDDQDMKKIISSVSWNTASGQAVSVDLETYLSQR
jgi:prepilin-type N-terminal cleavage/methylation domain-containing protein